MRVSSFLKNVKDTEQNKLLANLCYLHMLDCIKTNSTAELLQKFLDIFHPKKFIMHLEMNLLNNYIVIQNETTIYFAYHPRMEEYAMVYLADSRRSRNKQWKFWKHFEIPQTKNEYDFPKDVLIYLLFFCRTEDIINWRSVNKKWHSACHSKQIWLFRSIIVGKQCETMRQFLMANLCIEKNNYAQLVYIAKVYLNVFFCVKKDFVPRLRLVEDHTIYPTNAERIRMCVGVMDETYGPIVWFTNTKFRIRSFNNTKGYHDSDMGNWLKTYCLRYVDFCLFHC